MRVESDRTSEHESPPKVSADLELVRAISSGSLQAWHQFLEDYTGLIYGVVRRHLFAEDEDDARTVFVDVLKALYDGDIGKYRGDATLATWLIVYARSRAFDFVRHRYGRRRPPKWYEELGDLDRDVMRLFFAEHLPLDVVVHALAWSGHDAPVERIVESIQRIEAIVDPRLLAWAAKGKSARSLGLRSQQMTHWIVQMRLDFEEKATSSRPDAVLAEKGAAEEAERVRRALEELSTEEREIVERRFERGQTAGEIDTELGLGGERRAYTIIARILRKLRRAVMAERDEQL